MLERRALVQNALRFLGVLAVPPFVPGLNTALAQSNLSGTSTVSNEFASSKRLQIQGRDPVTRYSAFSIGLETLDRELFEMRMVLPALKILPVQNARIQSGWARSEKVAGQYDFSWLDECVDQLISLGIKPWLNVGYGNPVFMPEAQGKGAVGWVPLFRDNAMQAWLKYVEKVAERYKNRITYYEIWNEPYLEQFWKNAKPDPKDYARFAIPTMRAMRAINPNAKFVVGGIGLSGKSLDYAKEFLDAGVADYADVVSYHHYAQIPDDYYLAKINGLRQMLTRYPRKIAVWQGESGAPSAAGTAGALREYSWDEQLQAKWVARRMVVEAYAQVELSSYFHLIDLVSRDAKGKIVGSPNYKGLLHAEDASPKQAFGVYRSMVYLLAGKTPVAEGAGEWAPIAGKDTSVYGFASGSSTNVPTMWAYWKKGAFGGEGVSLNQSAPTVEVKLGHGVQSDELVLFDPLNQQVNAFSTGRASLQVPVADYPMFVVKRSILESFGTIV